MDLEFLARQSLSYLKTTYKPFPSEGFIAGGCLGNLIWGFVSNNTPVINDIDVFIYKGEYERVVPTSTSLWNADKGEKLNYLSSEKKIIVDYSGIASSRVAKDYYKIINSNRNGIFNFIEFQSSKKSNELILESFDINCTQIGYSIEEDKFYWTKNFEEFLKTGDLKLTNVLTPAHSAIRLIKKKVELNCKLSLFELELCKITISRRYGDINKFYFTEKYVDVFKKYENALSKHFTIQKSDEITDIFKSEDLPDLDIYQLKPSEITSDLKNHLTKINSSIYSADTLMFYVRNILGDEKKELVWTKLTDLFDSKDYIDCQFEEDDINLISRILKWAPNSIYNLSGRTLSQQLKLINTLLDEFSHDPIIAISILETKKLDKNLEFDEGTFLLLELSVRKNIVKEDKRIDQILNKKYNESI